MYIDVRIRGNFGRVQSGPMMCCGFLGKRDCPPMSHPILRPYVIRSNLSKTRERERENNNTSDLRRYLERRSRNFKRGQMRTICACARVSSSWCVCAYSGEGAHGWGLFVSAHGCSPGRSSDSYFSWYCCTAVNVIYFAGPRYHRTGSDKNRHVLHKLRDSNTNYTNGR